MILLGLPFLYSLVFLLIEIFSARKMEEAPSLKLLSVFSWISYLLSFLLLPDGGDTGSMYVFFGLLHSDPILSIAGSLCGMAVTASTALLIAQLCILLKIRKRGQTVK